MPRSRSFILRLFAVLATIALTAGGCASGAPSDVVATTRRYTDVVELPGPEVSGDESLNTVLTSRRSDREYSPEVLELATLGQLLWAGQGITDDAGHRTAPSAGARYPLELYVLSATELMHYLPAGHRAELRVDSTSLSRLADDAFGQRFVSTAPSVLVITGVLARTEVEYGALARDLMNREAGHAAQNILLEATALGLAAVPVGGFDPVAVAALLALPQGEEVLYLVPVGHPRTPS